MTTELTTKLGTYCFNLRGRSSIKDFLSDKPLLDKSTWSRIERGGGMPDLSTLIALHDTFDIPFDELMQWCREDLQYFKGKKGEKSASH